MVTSADFGTFTLGLVDTNFNDLYTFNFGGKFKPDKSLEAFVTLHATQPAWWQHW